MQTNGSLSPEQFSTLRSVYTFLEAATSRFDYESTSEDSEVSRALADFGRFCSSKMQASFPCVAEWRVLGGGQ
jgi:hypothetical protein